MNWLVLTWLAQFAKPRQASLLNFATSAQTSKVTSLSNMTIVSDPISETCTMGSGVKAAHGALKTLAYAAKASSAKYASFAFIFNEFDLRAYSGSACTSGFATHVETRSPPHFNYTTIGYELAMHNS